MPIKFKRNKENKPKKKKSIKNLVLSIFLIGGIALASLILAFALYIIITSPEFVPKKLYTKNATVIYANDGITEIARIGEKNAELVTYDELPQVFVDALVATEDSRFFQHNGFDAARFFKASLGQLKGNSDAGGASTLSMQVIKNTFNTNADGTIDSSGIKGIIRKFTDIYMAVFKLESVYTKEEIIEFYVNSQWLGSGSTNFESINGVEMGSQYFFGKSVSDLTLAEASLLVGIFNAPGSYNPYNHPEAASQRRSTVLSLMVRHGYITEEQKEFAESIPVESLLVDRSKEETTNQYQSFIDYLRWAVKEETGDDPYTVPMAIYTTLDVKKQDVLIDLEQGDLYKFKDDKIQYGLAITSVKDGSILALSPGRNYAPRGINRAVGKEYVNSDGKPLGVSEQPGSTAKPIFDYGPYLEYLHGSTGTLFLDQTWTFSNGTPVRNADYRHDGWVTMRRALIESKNIPAVQAFQQVQKEVGLDKIADFVHSLGIDYGENLYESAAIGGVNCASPLEFSAAYGAFARGGYFIEPYAFTKIVYLETDETYTHKVERTKVMSEQTAWMITDMLVSGGEANVGGSFRISGTDIAAKGGTTTIDKESADKLGIKDYTTPDHWNITYSPDYVIALWYGYDSLLDGQVYTDGGAVARKAIMNAVAPKIYETNSRFKDSLGSASDVGVVKVTVEKETYPTKLASAYTPSSLKVSEYYASGYEPSEESNRFSQLENPTKGKATLNGLTINLSWEAIDTPEAIDQTAIEKLFNDYYGRFYERYKSTYYQKRLEYNTNNIGTLGYEVSLVNNTTKQEVVLGYTQNTNFTYSIINPQSSYTFVVRSAYSIFKNNKSSGLKITAKDYTYSGLDDDEDTDTDNDTDLDNNSTDTN